MRIKRPYLTVEIHNSTGREEDCETEFGSIFQSPLLYFYSYYGTYRQGQVLATREQTKDLES